MIQAVEQGQFHIATMNNVADGIQYLTGHSLQSVNVMAEVVLKDFKIILETNFPKRPA